ncbi:MAG TPA: hypothetical protein VFJ91_02545 [Gaiellaceae bacterium]|nr:hypothetical protein [Gaiellaceae bacterium]
MTTTRLERPAPLRPVLVTIAAVTLGAYLLLGCLALAERAHGRWGLGLIPLVAACFAVAGWEVRGFLRSR